MLKFSPRWFVNCARFRRWSRGRRLGFVAILLSGVAIACLGAVMPPGTLRTTVTLEWDQYPTNLIGPGLVLKIYTHTNATAPLSTWPLMAIVSPTNTTVTLTINAQQRYFVMTSSNWWGESNFGNVAQTVALPLNDRNLRIGP